MYELKIQKNGDFQALPNIARKTENCTLLGEPKIAFIISLFRILHLSLLAVLGRPLFASRLMFSGIYARAYVSEWISSSILPEPLHKRDFDKNGLQKAQNES